jgi:hypothetical protein
LRFFWKSASIGKLSPSPIGRKGEDINFSDSHCLTIRSTELTWESSTHNSKTFVIAPHVLVVCMVRYYLPKGMRYSSLRELEQFYRQEFNVDKVKQWFEVAGEIAFAVVIGRHTRIHPEKYKKESSTAMLRYLGGPLSQK